MKMLRNLSEKLKAKFSATTRGYSMAKNARLDDERFYLMRVTRDSNLSY